MTSVAERSPAAADFVAARRAMIDSQLRVSGVNDRAVLEAMGRLARERFVPEQRRGAVYIDRPIPLGGGRVLNPPLSHGMMLTEARPEFPDRALLIGGATGYFAALLAPMVGTLHVVESDDGLIAAAPDRAGEWHHGPLAQGHAGAAPYTLMVIDGAIEQLPEPLARQLVDGGRLVTGLRERSVTRLAIGRKAGETVGLFNLSEADIAPLAEFAAPRGWSF